ncbi:MAG TPA: TetR/AcrR family transcriptional regulator [Jatrophihabitans sp.]|nr:TetR/AcrR family transcriptional regulator [Jatrophihabitans sp.]
MQAARVRVREELTREIKQAARRQLGEHGSAGLSLRAVARELGMVSSAVYRYFPSRDELLSALILDAHDSMAGAAEAAESAVRRPNLLGRWLAVASAGRAWALAQPQEYTLLFGSPVPGYRAPSGTIGPPARIPLLVMRILADAETDGAGPAADRRPLPRALRTDLRTLRAGLAQAPSEYRLAEALMAWTQLVGSISFEVFGQLHNLVNDYQGYFDYQMLGVGRRLGLSDPAGRAGRFAAEKACAR